MIVPGMIAVVSQPAFWNALVRVRRSLEARLRSRCWLPIDRPEPNVACASQLPPPATGEVRKPLRAAKPADFSGWVPVSSAASTTGA